MGSFTSTLCLPECNTIGYDSLVFGIDDADPKSDAVSGNTEMIQSVHYFDSIFPVYDTKYTHFAAGKQTLDASSISACNHLCGFTCESFYTRESQVFGEYVFWTVCHKR